MEKMNAGHAWWWWWWWWWWALELMFKDMQGAMSFHQFLACHELYSSTSSPIDELRRDTTVRL